MKNLKMMLVVTMLLVSTQLFAQNRNRDPEQMAKRQTERMKEKLSLTEDQASKVFDINKAISEKVAAARTNGELTADNRKEYRQKQMEERNTEFKKVLSEEQWTQWEEMKKEEQNRNGRERKGRKSKRRNHTGA